ncbi:MAG TPA: response regulator [Usitatibacter sp.]|nr:response regulator [Usitatibacter sp.]
MSTPLRVLIADDSKPIADMLTELLSDRGRVEVVGVGDSEHAVMTAIRELKPHVVVLDLQLAEGSGTEVIRAVRADAALRATRLLVTSNHVSPPMRTGCLELGADSFFDKVKELDALARRIGELADERLAKPPAPR